MLWKNYNESIKQFSIYPDAGTGSQQEYVYLTLGLASEAGEVASLMKKEIRDGAEFSTTHWASELGDCLWYITRLIDTMGLTLEDVLELNFNKLEDRKTRKVLRGSGDYR